MGADPGRAELVEGAQGRLAALAGHRRAVAYLRRRVGVGLFSSAEANIAYRFWHDVTHLERRRNFTNAHEIDMAAFHLWEAERHGLERGSLPWRLLQADSLGQTLHWAVLHEFVLDQRVFVLNVLQFGIETALLAEMARLGLLRPQVLPFGVDYTTAAVTPKAPVEFAP